MTRKLFIKWIIKGLAFVLLIVITCVTLLFLLTNDQNSYLAAIIDKHKLLASIPDGRVILVGGSAAALGLNSELLARTINKQVINVCNTKTNNSTDVITFS